MKGIADVIVILVVIVLCCNQRASGACVSYSCSTTPTCPTGYTYSACYDSCYMVNSSWTPYLTALGECVRNAGHFFVPNSQDELNYVMTLPQVAPVNYYWIGLQDWARRQAGTSNAGAAWSVPTSYVKDPDGVWTWMDGWEQSIAAPFSACPGGFCHPNMTWLPWQQMPMAGTHFIAYLYPSSNVWLLQPILNFSANNMFICEISQICASSCPVGWVKFLGFCYKFQQASATFAEAHNNCSALGSYLNSPNREPQLIFTRIAATILELNFWIGLFRSNLTSPWLWSISGSEVNITDALDVPLGLPTMTDLAFYTRATPLADVPNIITAADGSTSTTGGGIISSNGMIQMAFSCQRAADPLSPPTTSTDSSSTSVTTTPPPPWCVNYSCGGEPPCPLGYTYSSCFDSCYFVVSTWSTYWSAMINCLNDGAQLFVPNSQQELAYVMSLPQISTDNTYWLGLQDWARRSAGTDAGTWNVASGYVKDPDGVWNWIDGSNQPIAAPYLFCNVSNIEFPCHPEMTWLPWTMLPTNGVNFASYLTAFGTKWLIGPDSDFISSNMVICEVSKVCAANCPVGWLSYASQCFLYQPNEAATFDEALGNCTSMGQGITLWYPRTEPLVILARMMSTIFGTNFWIGLYRQSSIMPWKWSNNGSAVQMLDALDVPSGLPLTTDLAFYIRATPMSELSTIQYPNEGSTAISGGGFISNTTGHRLGFVCQKDAVDLTQTSSTESTTTLTTSEPTTITTTPPPPWCVNYSCNGEANCPPGYSYSSCFDSCYLVNSTWSTYWPAMLSCLDQQSHFFVPNSHHELDYVMSLPQISTDNTYWLGLQDWARRSAGTDAGTWNVASGYLKDPNGVWNWVDGSNRPIAAPYSYCNVSNSEFPCHPEMTWLPWMMLPSDGVDFETYLTAFGSKWLIGPASNFAASNMIICEMSNVCAGVCPEGWVSYASQCFLYPENVVATFDEALENCTSLGDDVTLWYPRTEPLVIMARMLSTLFQLNLWIGLYRESTGMPWRWTNDGSAVQNFDALDVPSGLPLTTDLAFYVRATPLGDLYSIQYPNNGSTAISGGGFISNTTGQLFGFLCQKGAVNLTEQETSSTESSTPTISTVETTTITTTPPPPWCVNYSCSGEANCPPGYSYSSCFDSCYLVNSTWLTYWPAMSNCLNDGAQLFVPNSQQELAYVMSLPQISTDNTYWLGLQDWARRSAGTDAGNWNVASGYVKDPDGVWNWIDGWNRPISGPYSFCNVSNIEFPCHQEMTWLPWTMLPSDGISFVSYLTAFGAKWLMGPVSNFANSNMIICEKSHICTGTCPVGWTSYASQCFLNGNMAATFDEALGNCTSMGPDVTLWYPRTEPLVIMARVLSTMYQLNLWIGLYRESTGMPWKWTNNGSAVQILDALDVPSGLPLTTDLAFYVRATPLGDLYSIQYPNNGSTAISGGGFISNTTGQRLGYFCQKGAVNWTEIETSTTGTTSLSISTETSSTSESSTTTVQTTETLTSGSSSTETSSSSFGSSTSSEIASSASIAYTTETSTTWTSSTEPSSSSSASSISTEIPGSTSMAYTTETSSSSSLPTLQSSTVPIPSSTPGCGNNDLESGEQCDDGNTSDHDGCSSNCIFELVDRPLQILLAVEGSFQIPFLHFPTLTEALQVFTRQLVIRHDKVTINLLNLGGRTSGHGFEDNGSLPNSFSYFGNRGNFSNSLQRCILSAKFLTSGSKLQICLIITAAKRFDDFQPWSSSQLLKTAENVARRLLVVNIGYSDRSDKLTQLVSSFSNLKVINIEHWDELSRNIHQILGHLITVA